MLAAILGVLDIITSFVLVTYVSWGWFSPEIVLYHALYVMLKGGIFFMSDVASKVDLLAGVYILLVAFTIFSHGTVTAIVAFWLVQKGMFSMLKPLASIFG